MSALTQLVRGALLVLAALEALFGTTAGARAGPLVAFTVKGDAIPAPLAGLKGDAQRGQALFGSRESNCSLCHLLPGANPQLMGNVGPPLTGIGSRLTPGQLRLRIVDTSRIHPNTVMPSYYRVEGLRQVARKYAGKPVLTAQEVEDLVAFLSTLR